MLVDILSICSRIKYPIMEKLKRGHFPIQIPAEIDSWKFQYAGMYFPNEADLLFYNITKKIIHSELYKTGRAFTRG